MQMLAHKKIWKFIQRGAYFWYVVLMEPKLEDEHWRRKEIIFNNILLSSILLLPLIAVFFAFFGLPSTINNSITYLIIISLLALCIFLYFLSRSGKFKIATHLFIGAYFICTTVIAFLEYDYFAIAFINYILIIAVSSILINTRYGFFITGCANITWILIELSAKTNDQGLYRGDLVTALFLFSFAFFIIMVISWLANREAGNSLQRARHSEKKLLEERNQLERIVEQRTAELKAMQISRVTELHRMAESGKLAAGFLHDLMNPLTAITLSITTLKEYMPGAAKEVAQNLEQAVLASKRMSQFISTIRKQSENADKTEIFSLNNEVEQAILLLSYKAKENNITLSYTHGHEVAHFGKALSFYQIISNLIVNAIEAYPPVTDSRKEDLSHRKVEINLQTDNGNANLEIRDYGLGIAPQNLQKIFTPFYSTKQDAGFGLGLAITKNSTEKDFNGSIEVKSSPMGTVFKITFPLKKAG